MQERNVLQEVFTATLTLFTDLLEPVKWFILAAVCLIVADLKFGIEAARKRGEKIRTSRATRRSVNIGGLYLLDIGGHEFPGKVFGEPFGLPILPALVLLVVYGCEINSCFNNYFEARGSKLRINIFKLFKNKSGDVIEPENRDE